jgi:ribosomal protein S27AE
MYLRQLSTEMACRNCGQKMLMQVSKARFACEFCQYRYIDMDIYTPYPKEELNEYINSLEKPCPECGERMTVNPMNQELVCNTCGLVYEDPIYTTL